MAINVIGFNFFGFLQLQTERLVTTCFYIKLEQTHTSSGLVLGVRFAIHLKEAILGDF